MQFNFSMVPTQIIQERIASVVLLTKANIDQAACLSAGVGRRDAAVTPTGMYSRRHADRQAAWSMQFLL